MYNWKIEYLTGNSIGRFKVVKADMMRISNTSGDIWFCDESDKTATNNYLPKFILAKGTFLSIERIDEPAPEKTMIYKQENEKMKTVDLLTSKFPKEVVKDMDWI